MHKISPGLIFAVDPDLLTPCLHFSCGFNFADFPKKKKKKSQKLHNFIYANFNPVKLAFARQVSTTDNGESFQNLVAGNQNHCAIYWKCALCKLLVTGDQKLLYSIGIKVIKVYKNKQNTVRIGTHYTEKFKPNVLIHYPIYSFYALSNISPKSPVSLGTLAHRNSLYFRSY